MQASFCGNLRHLMYSAGYSSGAASIWHYMTLRPLHALLLSMPDMRTVDS